MSLRGNYMKRVLSVIRKYYRILVPLIFFLITFLWESKVFVYSYNFDFMLSIARNECISDAFELAVTYLLSKVFCLVIIFLLWKAILYIFGKNIETSDVIILGIIYGVVLFTGIVLFPETIGIEIDNYANYSMAIRFLPTYWQGIYTGILYAGCLMIIPHPISLFVIQWTLFFLTVSFIYINVKRIYPVGCLKYVPLLVFLLPESYYLAFNPYRNNYYTILVLFYFSSLYFKIREKKYENWKVWDFIIFSIITAFIMVWRSEGVLVGACGLVLLSISFGVSKKSIRRLCIVLAATIISFIGINSVQQIGSDKYYGDDYMILNTTPVLHSILNNPNADFSYDTAQADLQSIEKIVPVEVIKEAGMTGFRNYNWTNGRFDFNQTLASDENAKAYMKAYYSIILHNLSTYFDVQINSFYSALQIPETHKTYEFDGEYREELDSFVYDRWIIGFGELISTGDTETWLYNPNRKIVRDFLSEVIALWRELIINSGMNMLLHAGTIIVNFILLLFECIKMFEENNRRNTMFMIAHVFLFGEIVAIMLFMPEGRAAYMYPMLYCSYFLMFVRMLEQRLSVQKSG